MGQAIGQVLPIGVGVALSPLPIIAVVLMLTTPRARTNGLSFILGWLAGLGVIGALVLVVAGPAGASEHGAPATWVSWLKVLLGVFLLVRTVQHFRGRPREGDEVETPTWLGAIEGFTAAKSIGLGALLSGANPKNTVLAIGAAATIAQTGIPGVQQAITYAVFAVIGTLGVGAPVVMYYTMGKRSTDVLAALKDWMNRHNAVIMSVLCLVFGTKLIGDAISALA